MVERLADRADPITPSSTIGIILPGFLGINTEERYVGLANTLNEHGIDARRINPPGIGPTGIVDNLYTQSRYLEELSNAVETARQDHDTVFSVGICWGGLVALLGAARARDVDGVIALMPTRTFIWPTAYDEQRADHWRRRGSHAFAYPDTLLPGTIEVPFSTVQDAMPYELLEFAPKVTCPALVVGGELDTVVPSQWLGELSTKLPQATSILHVVEGMGHDDSKKASPLVVQWLIAQSLKATL